MMPSSPYSNPYSSLSGFPGHTTTSQEMAAMFPAMFNLVSSTKNMTTLPAEAQPTPIEEIQGVLNSLPIEQRQAIESHPDYMELKSAIFQEFILWSIAATDMGKAYLLGPGSHKAKKLLELTKDLSSSIGAKATNKIQELEQALMEQQELFRRQSEEFKAFKAQFESEPVAHQESK